MTDLALREDDLHSVRADVREHRPSRGTTKEQTAAILIPKALAAYGEEVAGLLGLGTELERRFEALSRLEEQLRENGCTPPRPDFSAPLRSAWRVHRGELP